MQITLAQAKELFSTHSGRCSYIDLPYEKEGCRYCRANSVCPQTTGKPVDWETIEKMVKNS